jgi:AhpD family alkylhydroperoxidase
MKETLAQARRWIKAVGEMSPERMDGFHEMLVAIGREGALDRKSKELIAVALGVSRQSEWCTAYHLNQAIRAGSTDDEIIEAAWVAVLMNGAPSLMMLGFVQDTLQDYHGDEEAAFR